MADIKMQATCATSLFALSHSSYDIPNMVIKNTGFPGFSKPWYKDIFSLRNKRLYTKSETCGTLL